VHIFAMVLGGTSKLHDAKRVCACVYVRVCVCACVCTYI